MKNEKVVFQEWNSCTYKVFVWLKDGTTELGNLTKMGSVIRNDIVWWFEPKYDEAGFIMNSSDLIQIAAKLNELNKSEQERAHP